MARAVSDSVPLTGDTRIDRVTQGSSWTFGGGPRVLTYSFSLTDEAYKPEWTDAQKTAFKQALAAWSNVANIKFVERGSGGVFLDSQANIAVTLERTDISLRGLGIFPDPDIADTLTDTPYSRSIYPKPEGDIFLNTRIGFDGWGPGSFAFSVMLHEIGHALGLKHPFDDGGNGRPAFDPKWPGAFGGDDHTVMWTDFYRYGHEPSTPMLLDIRAIQHIYGANRSHRTGDDQYVFSDDARRAIWDAGGKDTLDFTDGSVRMLIDLRAGSVSGRLEGSRLTPYLGGRLAIGYGVTIENAIGSSQGDRITGNAGRNTLSGGGGNDRLDGSGAHDKLFGEDGADTLIGGAGNDMLAGGAGIDRLEGGRGNDVYFSDSAVEVIEGLRGGLDVLKSGIADVTLPAGVENLILEAAAVNGTGNEHRNLLEGNAGNNQLAGEGGNDTLLGGTGNDTLDGGSGNDVLDGGADSDSLSGGAGHDKFVWDALDVVIDGGEGADTLRVPSGDLDLTTIDDGILLSIERINLAGTTANVLTVGEADVLAMSPEGPLTILGDGADTVEIVGDFTAGGATDGFRTYTVGAATLLVDADVTVINVI